MFRMEDPSRTLTTHNGLSSRSLKPRKTPKSETDEELGADDEGGSDEDIAKFKLLLCYCTILDCVFLFEVFLFRLSPTLVFMEWRRTIFRNYIRDNT